MKTTFSSTQLLQFVNTVESRVSVSADEKVLRREQFREYEDLVSWSRSVKLISDKEAARFLKINRQEMIEAEFVRRRAIALREAVYDACLAIINRNGLVGRSLNLINEELAKSLAHFQLTAAGKKLELTWVNSENALDLMLWKISQAAADFFAAGEFHRLRQCGGENCGKLFFDTSRGGQRQWCEMKKCGNLAKVRQFRQRQKSSAD